MKEKKRKEKKRKEKNMKEKKRRREQEGCGVHWERQLKEQDDLVADKRLKWAFSSIFPVATRRIKFPLLVFVLLNFSPNAKEWTFSVFSKRKWGKRQSGNASKVKFSCQERREREEEEEEMELAGSR
jgi:hypothetical protein